MIALARRRPVRSVLAVIATGLLAAVAACSGSSAAHPATAGPTASVSSPATGTSSTAAASGVATAPASTRPASSSHPAVSSEPRRTPSSTPSASSAGSVAPLPAGATVPPGTGPVIVLDPGHSVTISATDPATGLNVSDYENEPEMRDVFAVALLVKAQLTRAGYRVVMTKTSVDEPMSLGERATIANDVHAALALSIHDQAGANGGIAFDQGNNTVYYQSVGTYRETPSGKKIYFTNAAEAALSKRYGQIFATERAAQEGHRISLLGNTGYDLGTRGLPAGDIWTVQLLSTVPWIYNEAGGNSTGGSGLDAADEQRYANGLVASVEHCVPV